MCLVWKEFKIERKMSNTETQDHPKGLQIADILSQLQECLPTTIITLHSLIFTKRSMSLEKSSSCTSDPSLVMWYYILLVLTIIISFSKYYLGLTVDTLSNFLNMEISQVFSEIISVFKKSELTGWWTLRRIIYPFVSVLAFIAFTGYAGEVTCSLVKYLVFPNTDEAYFFLGLGAMMVAVAAFLKPPEKKQALLARLALLKTK